VLADLVEANNDATLDELRHELEQKTGVLIGRSTVDRMLKKLNLSVKKKRSIRAKKRVNGCNSNVSNFGNG
jgi:putative transposase